MALYQTVRSSLSILFMFSITIKAVLNYNAAVLYFFIVTKGLTCFLFLKYVILNLAHACENDGRKHIIDDPSNKNL